LVFHYSSITCLFSVLFVTLWDFVKIQEMVYRLGLLNGVGLGLFLIGISIRMTAKRTLGKYYTCTLKVLPNHKLIKHGIYKHIRHPCYLAMILYSTGIPLIFSSLCGFLLTLLLIPCIFYRIRIEERMLIKKFGSEYLGYMKKSKRLVPYVY